MNLAISEAADRTFSALRFRNYRLYLTSQIISFSGTWMQTVAQAWLVLQLTGSGVALGAVTAAQFIPTLLLAPYGGTIADRLDKRHLIMATQAIAGLLALVLAIVTLTDVVELWMIYVVAIGFGAVTAIDNPSRQTFVMEMVKTSEIANAVTLNSVVVNAARAIGPAIAGTVIANGGVGVCFMINAASYIAVIAALFFLNRDELHPAARAKRGQGQIREGFAYVLQTPILRTTIVMLVLMGTLTYEFNVTLPMLAEFTFARGASGLAWMTALMGAGAVVGGLFVAAAGPPTPNRLIATAAGFGIAMVALAYSPGITTAYVIMPLVGVGGVAIISQSNATLHLNSDPRLRGRVMSLFSMALIGSTPLGGPIVGWIGEHISPRSAIMAGGVAALTAAEYGWWAKRYFRPNVNTPRPASPALLSKTSNVEESKALGNY